MLKILWDYQRLKQDLQVVERLTLISALLGLEFPQATVYWEEDEFVEGLQDAPEAIRARFTSGPVVQQIAAADDRNYEFRGRADLPGAGRLQFSRLREQPDDAENWLSAFGRCRPDRPSLQWYRLSLDGGESPPFEVVLTDKHLGSTNFGECFYRTEWAAFLPRAIDRRGSPAARVDLDVRTTEIGGRWGLFQDGSLAIYKSLRTRWRTQTAQVPLLNVSLPVVPATGVLSILAAFYSLFILGSLHAVLFDVADPTTVGARRDIRHSRLDSLVVSAERLLSKGSYLLLTTLPLVATGIAALVFKASWPPWPWWICLCLIAMLELLVVPLTVATWLRLFREQPPSSGTSAAVAQADSA